MKAIREGGKGMYPNVQCDNIKVVLNNCNV